MKKKCYLYIGTNTSNKKIFIGISGDLKNTINTHNDLKTDGQKKINYFKLLYYEILDNMFIANYRKFQLETTSLSDIANLIIYGNYNYRDLYNDL